MTKREIAIGRLLMPDGDDLPPRPRTRAECAVVPRPCPFVSCAHHLYLDVTARTGAIKLNFPDIDPEELPPNRSCALDVAEEGGVTLEETGAIMNITRERIRQIEVKALAKMQAAQDVEDLRDLVGGATKRRLPIVSGK